MERALYNPVDWEMVGLFTELVSKGGGQALGEVDDNPGSYIQSLAYDHTASKGKMGSD